jgi:hypothetical protein
VRLTFIGMSRRRTAWVIAAVLAVVAVVVGMLLARSSPRRTPTLGARPAVRSIAPTASRSARVPPSGTRPSVPRIVIPPLPVTDDPVAYAGTVAARLFDVAPAAVPRSDFLAYWRANLPTVVYADGAAKGLTLPEQNADAIDNLTHGWIPAEATWQAEATDRTVAQLRITSISVPDYWVNAVASGEFTDPGLHMERVMGVLTQTYGVGQRYTATRPIVIDLGLLCGPTQPGGCRLLAPQTPPGQDDSS